MNQRAGPARKPRLGAAVAWALAACLLFAQALGLAHAVAHAGHPSPQEVAALDDLFGHSADDEVACRLLDQTAAADALPATPPLPQASAPEELCVWLSTAGVVPACAASYFARAPPAAA